MQEYEADIILSECRAAHTYIVDLLCPGIAKNVVPGQFVQVRVGSGTDPFLRRTFSVCGVDRERGYLTLMIDMIGRGTEMLCTANRGDTLNIIGPLGTGFDIALGGESFRVLVAGGVGAAPLVFLAREMSTISRQPLFFMLGARTKAALGIIDGLLPGTVELLVATDDGSAGHHGLVTEILANDLSSLRPGAVYACGPHEMMKSVAGITKKAGVPCQVSLEERMACGIGACYGCVVKLRDGRMVRTCVDGPVFSAKEVFG